MIKRPAIAGAMLLLGACGSGVAAPRAQDGFASLATAFRQAHERKDVEALAALVDAPEVALAPPDTFRSSVRHDFAYRIQAITLQPIGTDEKLEYTQRGITYRPTLQPVGRMAVTFKMPAGGGGGGLTGLTSSYLVGVDQGRYRIVLAGPVGR